MKDPTLYAQLLRVAEWALVRQDEAADVVQTTLTMLYEKSAAGELQFDVDSEEAKAWLLTWTKRNSQRENYEMRRRQNMPGIEGAPVEAVELVEVRLCLLDITETPEEEGIMRMVLDGYGQQEIADERKLLQPKVHRTLKRIVRRYLKNNEEDEDDT